MKTRAFFGFTALSLALLAARPAAADEVTINDSARQHFKTGVAYLQDPDGARYEEAYREFKAAYADSPSWKILGNLGITAMKLERDGEAIDAFEKYLAGGGAAIDPSERSQMERDLMTTKSSVVYVTVKVAPAAATLNDERVPLAGRPVTNRFALGPDGSLRIGIRRGHHKFTAHADGYEDQTWELDAEPGAEQTHDFTLERPKPAATTATPGTGSTPSTAPAMSRPVSTPVIIGAVATGALLAGSGVVGLLAMGKNSDFKDKNDGQHVQEAQDLHDSGKTLNLVGDALLGGAVVAGVVTTILFINRPEVPAEQDSGTSARLRFTPAVGANTGGFVMSGRF